MEILEVIYRVSSLLLMYLLYVFIIKFICTESEKVQSVVCSIVTALVHLPESKAKTSKKD